MLTMKQKTVLEGWCIVDGKKICQFIASIDSDDPENMTLTTAKIDKVACKNYRDVIRKDEAAFEDYAYSIQDAMIANPATTN